MLSRQSVRLPVRCERYRANDCPDHYGIKRLCRLLKRGGKNLYEDIINDETLSDAGQAEALAELGTLPDFVSRIKSQSVTPVLSGIRGGIERLQTRTASRVANTAISAISEAAGDVNVAEQTIVDLWQAAVPFIEAWWQELYEDIINDDTLSDAEQGEALAELGTLPDFVSGIKAQYVTPVIGGIRQSTERLQTRTANRMAHSAIGAISEAAGDVNVTEQTILSLWESAVPFIEAWWQELYEDIINDPNLSDAEQGEALAELGTLPDFVSGIKAQYVTPVIGGIRQSTERLQTRTANREAHSAIGAIGEAAGDVNVAEQTIIELWQAAISKYRKRGGQELYEDIVNDPNLSDAEQGEAISRTRDTTRFCSRNQSTVCNACY